MKLAKAAGIGLLSLTVIIGLGIAVYRKQGAPLDQAPELAPVLAGSKRVGDQPLIVATTTTGGYLTGLNVSKGSTVSLMGVPPMTIASVKLYPCATYHFDESPKSIAHRFKLNLSATKDWSMRFPASNSYELTATKNNSLGQCITQVATFSENNGRGTAVRVANVGQPFSVWRSWLWSHSNWLP